jgi:rubredoxin
MDDPIHFECPHCKATHDRGYFDGVDTFRCLGCGYVGYGFHADEEIDAGIGRDIREAQKWNRDHGLPEGEFAP